MALVQKGNSRRTIILIAILAVAVIGGGVYLYLQNRPSGGAAVPAGDFLQRSRKPPVVTDFSDEVFSDPRFLDLQPTDPLDTSSDAFLGNVGKENPFLKSF